MQKLTTFFFTFVCIITGLISQVHRAVSADNIRAQLISSVTATGGQAAVLLGLKVTLPDGWKIYAPESNEKSPFKRHPQLDLQESTNLKNLTFLWPTSETFHENGEKIAVYKNQVIFPLWVELDNPNLALFLKGTVSFIACSHQCVPYDIPISMHLPAGHALPTADADHIKAYQVGKGAQDPFDLEEVSLWWMMMIAFLGGLILNFMPCVLPVLSLKLRTLIKQGHVVAKLSYKANFFATFMGIIVSFLAYGMVAVLLQWGGKSLGWGLHFQEPLFLVTMAVLMVIFTASLWGAVDIHLPSHFQTKMNDLIYHQKAKIRLYAEGFLSGVFATLLATPCTAPFLGTTLGYALSHGPWEILLLFLMLGLGFSLPYWMVLMLPPRLMPLPKPGHWLEWVSKGLGIGLLLSTLWIIWLFYLLQGPLLTSVISLLLSFLLLFLFLRQRFRIVSKLVIPLVIGIFLVPLILEGKEQLHAYQKDSLIQPFEPDKIPDLVAAGKIVFVDITASWCATCQVNKVLAFQNKEILPILQSPQVVYMQADWTTRNTDIRTYLARHKRYGIPFNQVFGPQAPHGLLLPELLTQRALTQAFLEAGYMPLEDLQP